MMALAFGLITVREQKTEAELQEKRRASITDELTGILNRHAYEEDIEKIRDKKHDKLVYIMMDLNGLKMVNDNMGHNAGDEYIIGAAKCMETPFAEFGKVYRIGGDEFVAILQCSKETAEDALQTFDHLVSTWKGNIVKEMTVSKGVVYGADEEALSLKEIIELSDKRMYVDKDLYYQRTGKKRREV